MDKIYQTHYSSPIGTLAITASETAIVSVQFAEEEALADTSTSNLPPTLQNCIAQLNEYFAGSRKTFDLPIASAGTAFQELVWKQLDKIGFGRTLTYSDLSMQLGNLGAIRAVGSANGKNKLLLIRPCHRVIGANGQLVGYAGGLWRKKWLLSHERTVAGTPQLTLFG